MGYLEAAILGLVQGLTEFLPVSSSAHLRVVPELLGWSDPGASFTAVVQLGTVAAVLVVFLADLREVALAGFRGLRGIDRRNDPAWRLLVQLILGSVPILVAGAAGSGLIQGPLRNLVVIGAALIVGSWWLWTSTRRSGARSIEEATSRDALLVGAAQVAALVPGISRSGATIGAGFRLGLSPSAAARYSFLLSIPAVVASGAYGLKDVGNGAPIGPTALAVCVAFVSGWWSIRWLLGVVGRGRFGGFVVYRLGLAAVVLVLAAT